MAASNVNVVVITGNLTRDPELRSTPGGTSICKLRVAVNSRRKDVPIEDPRGAIDWSRYKDYVSGQSEEYYQAMADFKKLVRSVLK